MENETENKADVKKISDEVTMNVLKTIFITIPSIIVIGIVEALYSVFHIIAFVLVCMTIRTLYPTYPALSNLFPVILLGLAACVASVFHTFYIMYRGDKHRWVEDEDI